jgi:hypothetical protein
MQNLGRGSYCQRLPPNSISMLQFACQRTILLNFSLTHVASYTWP